MRPTIELIRLMVREMTPRSALFRVLKEELSEKGYWKNLPRGRTVNGSMKKGEK